METDTLTIGKTPWVRNPEDVAGSAVGGGSGQLSSDGMLATGREFFVSKSLAELAWEQGLGPVKDISVFAGGIPDGEDVDKMLEEIYRLREPLR